MRIRYISLIVLGMSLAAALSAQNANPTPPAVQPMPPGPASGSPPGVGWRAGARGIATETGMGGRGVAGTVIAMAPGYYTVKTETGQTFKVQFSANTRFVKQVVPKGGETREKGEGAERAERGNRHDPPPVPIKASDIKIGDEIAALGEVSQVANSVGAAVIVQVDPERAKLLRERQADFGKTWLMGKVTAINETKVSLTGALDNAAHDFQADENTTFRKHRAPITLADIQVGDTVRVEGAVKEGSFLATSVSVMVMPQGASASVPRDGAVAPAPQTASPEPK